MARQKKTVTEKKKVEPKFSAQDVEAALQIAHREYFMNVIALLSHDVVQQTELSYVKIPITTPDGGTYLVAILHVEGPKLNLKTLAKAAEAKESELKPQS